MRICCKLVNISYHQFITKHHHHIGCPTEKLVEPVSKLLLVVNFNDHGDNIYQHHHHYSFQHHCYHQGSEIQGYPIPTNICNTYYRVTYQSVIGDEGSTVT